MKRLAFLSGIFLLFVGCSSINTSKLANLNEVALVGVSLNKRVTPAFSGAGGIISAIEQDEELHLEPILEKTANRIRRFETNFPFRYMSEADLFANAEYQKWQKAQKTDKFYISADGFANVGPRDEEVLMQTFRFLPEEVKGVMAVDILYTMVETMGIGPLSVYRVEANLALSVFDRSGEEVLKIRRRARSEQHFTGLYGAYNAEKLVSMADEATEAVLLEMDQYIREEMAGKK